MRQGRLDEAVQLLREAVRGPADYGPGLNRLASAYARLGLYNEAVATINRRHRARAAGGGAPGHAGADPARAGLLGQAEQSLQEAMARDPELPAVYEGLAEAARRRGDYKGAVAQVDKALALPRLDERAHDRLVERRTALQNEEMTVARLEQAVAAGTRLPEDLRALAAIEAGRARWERAADLQGQSAPEGIERERLAYYACAPTASGTRTRSTARWTTRAAGPGRQRRHRAHRPGGPRGGGGPLPHALTLDEKFAPPGSTWGTPSCGRGGPARPPTPTSPS
jgi:tetratricopeptide (TPR) repeat protein